MKCANCGHELPDNAAFCNYCGTPVQMPSQQTDGKALDETYPMEADPERENLHQTSGVPLKRKGLSDCRKIGIIVALCIVAGLSGFLIRLTGASGRQTEAPVSETELSYESPTLGETVSAAVDINSNMAETEQAVSTGETEVEETFSEETTTAVMEQNVPVFAGDVEEEVTGIREVYNNITTAVQEGAYDMVSLSGGGEAYYDKGELKAVFIPKNTDGIPYRRCYYFEGTRLFFAYYEGTDAHRFYFWGREMIRWRYSADAMDAQNAVNHDLEDSQEYGDWEETVLAAADGIVRAGEENRAPVVSMGDNVKVDTTSCLAEYDMVHIPEYMIDQDLTTGWCEGVAGYGEGEKVYFELDGARTVSGFGIRAGYHKSEDLYAKNSRPQEIEIEFSDGSEEIFFLEDIMEEQTFQFPSPRITDSVTLTINSVFPGTKYEDTVITEFVLY